MKVGMVGCKEILHWRRLQQIYYPAKLEHKNRNLGFLFSLVPIPFSFRFRFQSIPERLYYTLLFFQ